MIQHPYTLRKLRTLSRSCFSRYHQMSQINRGFVIIVETMGKVCRGPIKIEMELVGVQRESEGSPAVESRNVRIS